MNKQKRILENCFLAMMILLTSACSEAQNNIARHNAEASAKDSTNSKIVIGNERTEEYLSELNNQKVAIVGNHTSRIINQHLVDSLLIYGIEVIKVFSPEHGFRGTANAGQKVENQVDEKSGLPIISLYGKNKKPTAEQVKDIDIFIFDIQDVGVRFYTYISTLHYVMEAAAEHDKKVIVLDRPNPNDYFIDGPILEEAYRSFIGLHPVPVVYGMTIGEYAKMINGEGWLKEGISCKLMVVPCLNYFHGKQYDLPVAPSPNLPNMKSIYLYPSLCFFEGTPISVGRGTNLPFQQIGHPLLQNYTYSFKPEPNFGAKQPKLKGEKCFGIHFSATDVEQYRKNKRLNLSYLINLYKEYPKKNQFFTNFFNLLAGNSDLQKAIIDGQSESEIRLGWQEGLSNYKKIRKKYLLYQ